MSKICQPAAELCMINDGGNIVRSSLHPEFKNGGDILLDVQTTAAQSSALLSEKAKNRTFIPLPCKN